MNIITGGVEAFDALVYPQQHPSNIAYFENQWSKLPPTISQLGAQFVQNAERSYRQAYDAQAIRIARNALTMANSAHDGYVIGYNNLHSIQTATPSMQRWLMAAPPVKERYLKQTIAAYEDTYTSNSRHVGEEDYDYRRTMSGVVQETDSGFIIKHYIEDLLEQDKHLEGVEQLAILGTWDIMMGFMRAGIDPTDIYSK